MSDRAKPIAAEARDSGKRSCEEVMTLLFFVLRDSNMPGMCLCQQTIPEVLPERGSHWGKCHRCVNPNCTVMLFQAPRQDCGFRHPKLRFTVTSDGDQVLNMA